MSATVFSIFSLFLAVLTVSVAAPREFESSDGRAITAEVIELRENRDGVLVVELRRTDRKYFTIPVNRFSTKDRKYFEELWEERKLSQTLLEPDSEIRLNLQLNRKTEGKDDRYSGRLQDRKIRYEPEVVITNKEFTQNFEGNTVRFVVIARSMHDKGEYLIACAATKKIDFPENESVSVFGDAFFLTEYEYNSSSGTNYDFAYGFEKDDYVIVVQNRDGEITHTRASSKGFLNHMENVMKCKTGEMYSEDLEYRLNTIPDPDYFSSSKR